MFRLCWISFTYPDCSKSYQPYSVHSTVPGTVHTFSNSYDNIDF